MQQYGVTALWLVVVFMLQSSFISILPMQVKPDLVLILVIFFSLYNGVHKGLVVGAVAGLLEDLLRGNLFGMNLLALSLIGGMVGWLENRVFKENITIPVIVVFLGTLVHALLIIFISLFAGIKYSILNYIQIGLLESLYNVILVLVYHGKIYLSSIYRNLK